jgi:hypothetical protein
VSGGQKLKKRTANTLITAFAEVENRNIVSDMPVYQSRDEFIFIEAAVQNLTSEHLSQWLLGVCSFCLPVSVLVNCLGLGCGIKG